MGYSPEEISTRSEIEDVVLRLFVSTDERDWPTLEHCFTSPFTLDMTSLVGGSPAVMKPSDISAAWAAGFAPLDHVHHQVSNFQTSIQGDSATVKCYGIAFHHRSNISSPAKSRTFVGTYRFELTRIDGLWLVNIMTFTIKFIDGNLDLENAK